MLLSRHAIDMPHLGYKEYLILQNLAGILNMNLIPIQSSITDDIDWCACIPLDKITII